MAEQDACPHRVLMPPTRPPKMPKPMTLVRDPPRVAAANSAGPRCPTNRMLVKPTSLLRRWLAETGIDSLSKANNSAVFLPHRFMRVSNGSLSSPAHPQVGSYSRGIALTRNVGTPGSVNFADYGSADLSDHSQASAKICALYQLHASAT